MNVLTIIGDPGAVSRVEINGSESFQERAREPLSWMNSIMNPSRTHQVFLSPSFPFLPDFDPYQLTPRFHRFTIQAVYKERDEKLWG